MDNPDNLPDIPGDKPGTNLSLMLEDVFNESAKKDFTQARSTILKMMDQGTVALETLLEIAKQSQHPRAFEVVANLIKTNLDAAKELMDNHLRFQKAGDKMVKPGEETSTGPKTVNNNLIMSTDDFARLAEKVMSSISNRGKIIDHG